MVVSTMYTPKLDFRWETGTKALQFRAVSSTLVCLGLVPLWFVWFAELRLKFENLWFAVRSTPFCLRL